MLLVGEKNQFGIQSQITQAYERLSFRALGYFVIYLNGRRFGKEASDATMLACSLDAVQRRLANRGLHTADFANAKAEEIAAAIRRAIYSPASKDEDIHFGYSVGGFVHLISDHQLGWAPDGDEAFDDGSYILQFDVGKNVRLIGFKAPDHPNDYGYDPRTLEDVWMPADSFYQMLREWQELFLKEWNSVPKISETADGAVPKD